MCYGLVAPLWDMCRGARRRPRRAAEPGPIAGSATSTKLKVTGVDLFSAGDFSGGDGAEDIVLRDASRGVYKRVVLRDDKVVGAVLYGDTADGGWYFDLLKKAENVSSIRDLLIFGQAFAQGGEAWTLKAAVAALIGRYGRDLRLQRRIQGQGHRGHRQAMARAASTPCARPPRHRRRAGPAPGWSSRCSRSTLGDEVQSAPQADVQMHRPSPTTMFAAPSSTRS